MKSVITVLWFRAHRCCWVYFFAMKAQTVIQVHTANRIKNRDGILKELRGMWLATDVAFNFRLALNFPSFNISLVA